MLMCTCTGHSVRHMLSRSKLDVQICRHAVILLTHVCSGLGLPVQRLTVHWQPAP